MDHVSAKVIAQILIAKSGESFDDFAFDECVDLSDEDRNQILGQVTKICQSTIARIEKTYGLDFHDKNSTKKIIEEVIFE